MNSKGQGIPRPAIIEKWYDAYVAVEAFNHCIVAGEKHGWEHRIKLHDDPNFPLFTGVMSFIDANIYHTMQLTAPQILLRCDTFW